MQCPRCGLQNAPGAEQCIRCSHAFAPPADQPAMPPQWQQDPPSSPQASPQTSPQASPGGWQHPSYAPKPPPPPPPPEPEYGSAWRVLAAIVLPIAALANLAYGGWVMTERRAIFAALAADEEVSRAAARESDRLHELLLWAAVATLVLGTLLWLLAHLVRRKPLGTTGFTAIALFATGVLVAIGGAYVTSLADGQVAAAGNAAVGFLIMGGGFLLLGGGAVAALVAVFKKPPRAETPVAGFAGWQSR